MTIEEVLVPIYNEDKDNIVRWERMNVIMLSKNRVSGGVQSKDMQTTEAWDETWVICFHPETGEVKGFLIDRVLIKKFKKDGKVTELDIIGATETTSKGA